MNHAYRYLVVFFAGASVMVLEIVGTRSLAPVYGGSLMVWASQIGVTLGSLAIGYVLLGAYQFTFFDSLIWGFVCLAMLTLMMAPVFWYLLRMLKKH